MRPALIFVFSLLTYSTFSQVSRKEIAESKIYVRATYFDQKNEFLGLQARTDLQDTIINNRVFKKFKTESFTDYSEKKESRTYYESFSDSLYFLLDNNQNIVHQVNFSTINEQNATLFGKKISVSLEFIDTRRSYPRDNLIPTNKTPRKYYQTDNSEIYLVIIPDLKTLAVSSNGQYYTKQLYGDNYNDISEGFKNNYQATTRFDIQKGDEIQLFYRRKWYNDTTNLAEYQDKQFKNVKYLGDTIIDHTKSLIFQIEGYNYLSGSKEGPDEFLIQVTDSGYYSGYYFIPFKTYTTELKITEQNGQKGFFLQGVCVDTIDGFSYQKIVQATTDPYRYFILPFFPMPFVEFGNVQGIITYTKIKGVESGTKRERTYITDKNNIRDILSKSKKEVEVIMYFIDQVDIEIEIQDYETDENLGTFKSVTKKGLNSFIIKTEKMEKNKTYRVQINFIGENNSGSFSNSVKSKY